MKKSEIFRVMTDLLARDHERQRDRDAAKILKRERAEQRTQRVIEVMLPLLSPILGKMSARSCASVARDLGYDLARALSALDRSLLDGQRFEIGNILTEDQSALLFQVHRLVEAILGSPGDGSSESDLRSVVDDLNERARVSSPGGASATDGDLASNC